MTTPAPALNLDLPEIATPAQVSAVVGKSQPALAQDRNRGRGIPYIRLGFRIRYLRTDVENYILGNRVPTDAPIGGAA
ncbi:helix-turn-helix domain-containing protein [Mycobacterium sp. 94-17]|uniref:helix-turn-helix transcriptional regulator n=1 Tax=Mycobacterium sp. 94-17 TaxID=2986147 RepID=UPI002D1F673C|nr:helix-turn-helix domain-containing protein [Mycobacterium sp. 94-17]MEB4208753.1 helix-turn-helix domain-containing protein [Mycobacterium sp. 94-17]